MNPEGTTSCCYQQNTSVPTWNHHPQQHPVNVTVNRTVPVLLGLGVDDALAVTEVQRGGLAEQHGLEQFLGWTLTHVNGVPCTSVEEVKHTQSHSQTVLTFYPPPNLPAATVPEYAVAQQQVPFYPYDPSPTLPTPNTPLDTKRYIGVVKSFNSGTGFGFITCPELHKEHKRDVFIHKNHASGLVPRDTVRFSIEMNKKNMPQAAFVEKLESGKKKKAAEKQ